MSRFELFATCARGLEGALADELGTLGLADVRLASGGVAFAAVDSLADAYRAVLWSRVASRVLVEIARFACDGADALYAGARRVVWHEQLAPTTRFAVSATRAPGAPESLNHTHFIALKVKDAIVDHFRERDGTRPDVDTERPGLRVYCHLADECRLYVDLGGALHERGYRVASAIAPLRETLAAGILRLAHYDGTQPLCDPFCGSGTLLIEAALIAANLAPGLLRALPTGWLRHDFVVWRRLRDEAEAQKRSATTPTIWGSDTDPTAIAESRAALARAGVAAWVGLSVGDARTIAPPSPTPGIVVTNPPYGERIAADSPRLLEAFGDNLRRQFLGWNVFLLAGDERRGANIGLRARHKIPLWNGSIECRLLDIPISDRAATVEAPAWRARRSAEAETFANRLRKNVKHLQKWAKREDVTCYRLYDADIPEFAIAVDLYETHAHVAEYAYPSTVDENRAIERLRGAIDATAEVLGITTDRIAVKERRRHARGEQYQRVDERGEFFWVHEGGLRFSVNLFDYLDTGLFLDQRRLRARIGKLAAKKRFLNLFAYTGSATVYAVRGGATSSVTVDLSNTYLDWAERNFHENQVPRGPHEVIRADVLEWLRGETARFDLVFVSPPTFSNSKAMHGSFDIERDHGALLQATKQLVAPGGTILFSTHRQKFKLDEHALATAGLVPREITHETMSPDFARRSPHFHRTWEISV